MGGRVRKGKGRREREGEKAKIARSGEGEGVGIFAKGGGGHSSLLLPRLFSSFLYSTCKYEQHHVMASRYCFTGKRGGGKERMKKRGREGEREDLEGWIG